MRKSLLRLVGAAFIFICLVASCDKEEMRVPSYPVYLPFMSQGDWVVHGVAGAAQAKSFIKQDRVPSSYQYNDTYATGFGGVLLVTGYMGDVLAYDLACPVEMRGDVRVTPRSGDAICPHCGSTFDIYATGRALTGEAATEHWSLRRLSVLRPGPQGEYLCVRP